MKKILPIFVIGVLLISGMGVFGTPEKNIECTKQKVSFNDIIINNVDDFISIELDGANSKMVKQNKPLLPSFEKTYKVTVFILRSKHHSKKPSPTLTPYL